MSQVGDVPLPQWAVLDGYTYTHQEQPVLQYMATADVFTALQNQMLSPKQIQSLHDFWCANPAPKKDLQKILSQDDAPSSAQVLAINVLSCHPDPNDLLLLWEVFFSSRFGIRAEDPDLFSRSLQSIIDIESLYPQSNRSMFDEHLPHLIQNAVLHRDQITLSIAELRTTLNEYYAQHTIDGIRAFTSEGGSAFQDIITAVQQASPTPTPPQKRPGQYQSLLETEFYQAPITQYSVQGFIPIVIWGIILFIASFLLYQKTYRRLASLLFSCGLLCIAESICASLSIPTRAEQEPLFSFVDFSFSPYEQYQRKEDVWWISQGGPARWQEIPIHPQIFQIAVLGASSAHASNLLQEESFSAQIEQRLQKEFPTQPIQVVNMAIGGTISDGILSSGKQAIELGADAIIIYYGHNEVAQFQQLSKIGDTSLLWLKIPLSQSHLYGFLYSIVPKAENTLPSSNEYQNLASHDQIIEWATQNHYQNINTLLTFCTRKNIPVLQIVPTYNFRFAPAMPSEERENREATQFLVQGKSIRPHNIQKAQEYMEQAIHASALGSATFLEAQQIQAELYAEQNQFALARKAYQTRFDNANDITTIHTHIRDNIFTLAQKHGTALLDAEDVFYHFSPDGITANGLFWDELHPTTKGHSYLANAIIPWARVQTSNFLDSSPNP